MASKKNDQKSILRLEEDVTNLTEELCQCQADKEFVWSLWKRLQVANPDITQAISLVVEREKIKSEAKDRKVLEILQVKDGKIQELEKRASGQQQEINNLVQRKMAVDEENILLKKELNDLQQELKDKSQELKTAKESTQKNEEQCKTDLEKLAQENEELNKRCSDLHSDLEKARKQEAQWRREKSSIDAKIKDVEVDLKDARREIEVMHSKNNELSSQVTVKQMELAQKQVDVSKLRKELQDLQNLYKQSNEYAAQQAELIQQLQSLNMDTQKVLRSQEDAHTTETISYQKLYNDLNTCYETVKSSETQLRQNNFALTEQLHQREQQVSHLQIQLQDALNALSKPSEEPKTTEQPSLEELELIIASQKSEIKFLQDRLKTADFQITKVDKRGSGAPDNSILRARKQEMPPVKRSRSLSPMGFSREEEELKKLKIAEKRIEHLEKALQIKIQENAGIRKAHDNRKERFISLQTNFKVVTDQFKKSETGCINENGKYSETPRAEFWQLRHEDSDAVWNELAHFRREQQKLLVDKMNLEEEIDQLKVQLSSDKATIQELKSCLHEEREVLLLRLSKDETVKSSTPKKNTEDTLQRALQKINHLSQKLKELEPETRKLQEANEELTKEKHSLKTTIKHLQREADAREQKLVTIILENQEVKEARDKLEMKEGELTREIKSLKRLLSEEDKLRNENRDLRRQLWTLQHTLKQTKVTNLASKEANKQKEVRAKVKQSATKKISLRRHQAFLNQSIKVMSSMFENFSKDGWENVSEDSDSEIQSSGSLGQVILKSTQTACSSLGETSTMEESTTDEFTDNKDIAPEKVPRNEREIKKEGFILKYNTSPIKTVQREKKNKTTSFKQGISMTSLRDRIASLQHKVTVLQRGKRAATESANEFKKAKIELAAELHLAHQRLLISKQMLKKLSLDLTELQREKEYMEQNLEQMKVQLAQFKRSSEVQCPVTSDLSPAVPLTPSKNIDPEMKQLQNKLKSMTTESTKQSSAIKSLRSEVHEKEERIQELQERAARMERDVNMKRHLIEDLKTRLKAYQENERPRQEMLESLERKVKTLTEECSQKKTSIDSLRQRLSIATKEKAQHEQMYRKVQEELDKKRLRITDLESKVTQTEVAMNELEKAAAQQLHNLAIQSEKSMEVVQDKLLHVTRRADELVTFVKHLAKTLQIDICEIRRQIRQAKIMQESKSGPSKESVNRAQSLAASILNISRSDLNEILDDGQEIGDLKKSLECDKDWMNHIVKLLEGQFPFESNLMDAILDKLDEKKKLIVEHTLLKRDM